MTAKRYINKDCVLPASMDGLRTVTHPCQVPTDAKSIVAFIPYLKDAANISAECGLFQREYLWNAFQVERAAFETWDSSLVAYYTFDDDGETNMLLDASANSNDLTKMGTPTFGGGPFPKTGLYVTFAGTDQYLKRATASCVGLSPTTNDFTIMATISMAATTDKMVIASKRAGASGDGVGWEFGITATDSYPYLTIEDADSTSTIVGAAAVDTGIEIKLHVTCDRDGNGQMYINGVASGDAVDISGDALTLAATRDFRIGCDGATAGANFFIGKISEFAMWSDLRSESEILQHVNGGFMTVANVVGGADLVVCATGNSLTYIDMTDYISPCPVWLRFKLATAQTTNTAALIFPVIYVTE